MNKLGVQRVGVLKNQAALAPVEDYLSELHERVAELSGGKPADYIPELGKVNPSLFGIAIATVDGQVYAVGDTDCPFTIQSVSKPFLYGYAPSITDARRCSSRWASSPRARRSTPSCSTRSRTARSTRWSMPAPSRSPS